MRIQTSCRFLVLLLLSAFLIPVLNPEEQILCAQELLQQKFRRVYVPEDLPNSWPAGNWQPISSKKYFQILEDNNSKNEQLLRTGLDQAIYNATYHQGQLVHGTLIGQINNPRLGETWQNLGQTNLSFQSLGWKQGKTFWGSNPSRDFFILQNQNQKLLQGHWTLNGRPHSKGFHFDLNLLTSTQTTLHLILPSAMQLQLNDNSQTPVFVRELSPDSREWTLTPSTQTSLSFSIDPVADSSKNTLQLARYIHHLNLGVSQQTFVTEIHLELPIPKDSEIQLFLPEGYQTEKIEIDQENLSTWKSHPSSHQDQPGNMITLLLSREQFLAPVNIRLSGELRHYKNQRLTTRFPKVRKTIETETQLTVSVQPPLRTAMLDTKSLHQIDSRLGSSAPDTWSYTATGIDPILDISVATPTPRLEVQQLIFCQQDNHTITDLRHLMLWSTDGEGVFTGKFRLVPGFEVQDITVLSDRQTVVPSTWSIRTEKDRDILYLHLSNQLVPGQILAVSIALRLKTTGKKKSRITLPAVQLINGDVTQNLLLISQDATIKVVPPNLALKEVDFSQLNKWSAYWKELNFEPADSWRESWTFKEIPSAAKIILLPEYSGIEQTDSNSESPLSTSSASVVEQPKATAGSRHQSPNPLSDHSALKSIPAENPQWKCQIKAIIHNDSSCQSRVQLEYINIKKTASRFSEHFVFPSEVFLHSVSINNHYFSIEKQGTEFTVPAFNQINDSVIVNYSYRTDRFLPLPNEEDTVSYESLLLCLPQGTRPVPSENILLWQKNPFSSLLTPGIIPAFSDNNLKTTHFDVLLQNQTLQHGYSLYEALIPIAPSNGKIRIVLSTVSVPWLLLIWLFLILLILCLFLNYRFRGFPKIWFYLSLLASVTASFSVNQQLLHLLLPITVVFFITAQLPAYLLDWWTRQTHSSDDDSPPKRSGALRYLLTGSHGLLLLFLWLNTQTTQGQETETVNNDKKETNVDLLIPIKNSLLTPAFKGLSPEDYPDVLYLSEKHAEQLREYETRSSDLSAILIHSALYDLQWTRQENLQIHCQFKIIDARKEKNTPFVLPITGIDSLPALNALVDGQKTDITPLPNGSGLEISLPKNSKNLKQGFREYVVELDIVPQHNILPQGTEISLGIPPAAQAQLNYQFPSHIKAQLIGMEQGIIELTPTVGSESAKHQIGSIKKLKLMTETISDSDPVESRTKYEQLQSSILAHVHPRHIAMRLYSHIKYASNSDRTIAWKLPPGMSVRFVHALPEVDYHIEPLTEGESLLKLKFPDSGSEENSILVDLFIPLSSDHSRKEFSLPSLIAMPSDMEGSHQLKIALLAGAGFELSQVKFLSITTSRITPSVFLQNWPEQDALPVETYCYRLQDSGQMNVKLDHQESELSVISKHRFQSRDNQLFLNSQYFVDVIGAPLWSVTFNAPEIWDVTAIEITSEGTAIPARVMRQNKKLVIAFASSIEEEFVIDINCKKKTEKKLPGQFTVTPLRIQRTLYYQENLSTLSSTGPTNWLLSTTALINEDSPPKKTDSKINWSETLKFEEDDQLNLPAISILANEEENNLPAPQELSTPTVNEKPSTGTFQEAQPPDALSASSATRSNQENNLNVKIDHTLWRENNYWLGETLVLWNNSGQNGSKTLPISLQIQLPKQIQVLNLSYHRAFSAHLADHVISVTSQAEQTDRSPLIGDGLMIIHWKTPRNFSWTGIQSLPFPSVKKASSVSWRLIDSLHRNRNLAKSIESWKAYFLLLGNWKIDSEDIENSITDSKIAPDEMNRIQLTPLQPGTSTGFYDQVIDQVPEQRLKKILSLQNHLQGYSWNQPIRFKIMPVIASGRSLVSLDRISVPVENQRIRYSILLLASFWGWGMWKVNHTTRPEIRRRHLALCSFLIVGLIAVQMLS